MTSASPKKAFNAVPTKRQMEGFINCVEKGNKSAVTKFLDKFPGAIDQQGGLFNSTALPLAAGCGDIEMVALLLERGADVNGKCSNGDTALVRAAGDWDDVVALLLKKGAAVDIRGEDDYTPLMCAVASGNKKAAVLLLRNGASLNEKASDGETALTLAFEHEEIHDLLKRWPERQKQEHKEWLAHTDFSKGLKRAMPATRPLIFPKKGM